MATEIRIINTASPGTKHQPEMQCLWSYNYDPTAVKSTVARPDVSKRLKQAFQALEQVSQVNEHSRPRSKGEKA